MSEELWLTVTPMHGDGDSALLNTGTPHTGRSMRSSQVTAVENKFNSGKSYQATQKSTGEFLIFDKKYFSVVSGVSAITITGRSNAKKITFFLGSNNNIPIIIPNTYMVNGFEVTNGVNIQGDPGIKNAFTFVVVIPIPKNSGAPRIGEVIGSGAEVVDAATINQDAASLTVTYVLGTYIKSIDKTSESIIFDGTATATATIFDDEGKWVYTFDGWYEGSVKISSLINLSVSNIVSNRIFTAVGKRETKKLTITTFANPVEGGAVSGAGVYNYEDNAVCLATPSKGFKFLKFTVNNPEQEFTDNPINIFMVVDKIVNAYFISNLVTITTQATYRIDQSGEFVNGTRGGITSGGGTVSEDESMTVVATPNTGYTFLGWYNGEVQMSTDLTYIFTAEFSVLLSGRFQLIYFRIRFIAGAGGRVSPSVSMVPYGSSSRGTATPNTGYTFTKWSNGVTTPTLNLTNIKADATYTATFTKQTFLVTYVAGTGIDSVTPASETVIYGEDGLGSVAVVSFGYTFLGWYNGEVQMSTDLTYIPQNIQSIVTFTAKSKINSFIVSVLSKFSEEDNTGIFATGNTGGVTSGGGTYEYQQYTTLVASPNVGYVFLGWFNNSGVKESSELEFRWQVVSNQTFEGRFQKNWFTVTFTKGEGVEDLTISDVRAPYNGLINSEKAVALTGYNSPTWTKTIGSATLEVTDGIATLSVIQSDCTLVSSATVDGFTITYTKNVNISSLSKESEVVLNGGVASCEATVKPATPAAVYIFSGWYEGATQVSVPPFLYITNITSNRTFEARAQAVPQTYYLGLLVSPENSGTVIGSGFFDYGKSCPIEIILAEAYDFIEWYNDTDSVVVSTDKKTNFTLLKGTSLTAKCVKKSFVVQYEPQNEFVTVSRENETVFYDENALGSTATVVGEGRDFAGWYNTDGMMIFSGLTYAPQNIVFNEVFQARTILKKFKITVAEFVRDTPPPSGDFAPGTGDKISSLGGTYNYGTEVIFSVRHADPYMFLGWFTEGSSGGELISENDSITVLVTNNRNIYARFQKKYITINYDKGNYVESLNRTTEQVVWGGNALGCTISPMASTEQYSYTVDGWYDNNANKLTSDPTFAPMGVTGNSPIRYVAQCLRTTKTVLITYSAGMNISSISRTSEEVPYGSNAQGSTAIIKPNDVIFAYAWDGWYVGVTKVSSSITFAPTNVIVPGSYKAMAYSNPIDYTISASVQTESVGKVEISGDSGVWGNSVSQQAPYDAFVDLHARLISFDYTFDGWYSGGVKVSSDLDFRVTVKGNKTYDARVGIAVVSTKAMYRSTPYGGFVSGTLGGTVSGGGTVLIGTGVACSALVKTGYSFTDWYDGSSSLSSNTNYTYIANKSAILQGRFSRLWFTIRYTSGTGGSVSVSSSSVEYGSSATCTATPNTGYTFTKWSNGVTTPTLNLTNIKADATYTATFTKQV